MNAAQNLVKTARKTFTLRDLTHHEKYKYKSLIEMVAEYPNHGVGFRISKIFWPENHYIHIMRVELTTNRIGKIYGKKYIDGRLAEDQVVEVDGVTTRGLWRYDLGDAMCILDQGLVYTLSDLEKHFRTVRQRNWKRPADLRKNMDWIPPADAIEPIENENLFKKK